MWQGLAFDALQQCFRAADIDAVMDSTPPVFPWKHQIYLVIDPAAGGPQSDFALVSFYRYKGVITVSLSHHIITTLCIPPLAFSRGRPFS